SYKIVSKIMNLLGVINYNIEFFNLILRKLSHFIEYFILLIVVFLLVEMFIKFSNKSLIISIIICFLYSVSDEIHQLFISGRTSNMFDVLIDSTGIIFSALIIYIIKNR
ncbi:MAG: VanZ family protein, partial [Clostridiales bacterium]